jgi:hypothetical protein
LQDQSVSPSAIVPESGTPCSRIVRLIAAFMARFSRISWLAARVFRMISFEALHWVTAR